MQKNFTAIAGVFFVIFFTNSLSAQAISPRQSRQTQFLCSQEPCGSVGPSKATCDSVFQRLAHESGTVALALSHRSSPLQRQVPMVGPDTLSEFTNMLCSNQYLKTGWNAFTIPSALVPSEWSQNSWWFIHDGEEIAVPLDSIVSRYIEPNAEGTMIGLKSMAPDATLECHMLFPVFSSTSCVEPDLPPWDNGNANDPRWIGCFQDGAAITGQALVKIGSDSIFDRPLIFLQGFDPGIGNHWPEYGYGDFNWDIIWGCGEFGDSGIPGLSNLISELLLHGFDLVFLDQSNGAESIENQSALTRELIGLCRDYKFGDEPMVLIGPSLGGVVGRHALRSMEINGEEHCTRLFAGLDSPFRGAWLPTSLQEAIPFFAGFSAEAEAMNAALHSPAAGQLLIHSPFHSSSVRQNLENLQDSWGLPKDAICIATSNGNPAVNYSPSNPRIFHSTSSLLGWDYVDISLFTHPGSISHPSSNPEALVIFDAEIINPEWTLGEPFVFEGMAWSDVNLSEWNDLPGSYSTHLGLFRSALELSGIEANSCDNQSMFIPVSSSVDIDLELNAANTANAFDAWSFETPSAGSVYHCDLSAHSEFLTDWIVSGQPLSNSNADPLNFAILGWNVPQKKIIGSLNLAPLGKLEIGTALANGEGPWPIFEAFSNTCDGVIEIGAGGSMIVGDSISGSGANMTLMEGSRLILNEGSKLHIGSNSSFQLESNARVELNGGQIIIHPGGQLHQDANSQLIVHGHGIVQLRGTQANWLSQGDLLLTEADTLLVEGAEGIGAGTWNWSGNQVYTYLGPNSLLDINPDQNNGCDIILPYNSGHLIQGGGHMRLHSTNIHLSESSNFQIETTNQFQDCFLSGTGHTSVISCFGKSNWNGGGLEHIRLNAFAPGIASFKASGFSALDLWLETNGAGVQLNEIEFLSSHTNLNHLAENSWIQLCNFQGGLAGAPLLSIRESSESFRMESCTFSSHVKGIEIEWSELDAACSEFENLVEAVVLQSQGILNVAPPYGQNYWHDNAVHIKFENGPIHEMLHGNNEWGLCTEAIFSGTTPVSTSNGNSVVAATGNAWMNSPLGAPIIVPYTALQSSIDGGTISLKDMSPASAFCQSAGTPEEASVKKGDRAEEPTSASGWSLFPNPADEGFTLAHFAEHIVPDELVTLSLSNELGRQVFQREMPLGDNLKISTQAFASGWYTLHIASNTQKSVTFKVLISHP